MTDTPRNPTDTSGALDEALERIHLSGPERDGWLSNHAPMAVEALVRHGQAPAVHRWRTVLAEWWPRLLPGIAAGATHPVIRLGHSVRTLLEGEETAPRVRELAHALGYWAARHQPLPALERLVPAPDAATALDRVPLVARQEGGTESRFERLTGFPAWPGQGPEGPGAARAALRQLVRASTHRYATHGHAAPVMLVHAATAPNAVLRTLPALPGALWAPGPRSACGLGGERGGDRRLRAP